MTARAYMGRTIEKNIQGRWIVTHKDGSYTTHATLKDAKETVAMAVDLEENA